MDELSSQEMLGCQCRYCSEKVLTNLSNPSSREQFQVYYQNHLIKTTVPLCYRWDIEHQMLNALSNDPKLKEMIQDLDNLLRKKVSIISNKTKKEFTPMVAITKDWYSEANGERFLKFNIEFPGIIL